jgi:hypothetical protein
MSSEVLCVQLASILCAKNKKHKTVTGILKSELFLAVGTTLISLAAGVFVRAVSRKDQHKFWVREDFAVGIDLFIASVIVLVTRSISNLSKLDLHGPEAMGRVRDVYAENMSALLTTVLGGWIVSTIIRRKGWEAEHKLKMGWGILVPTFWDA